MMLDDDDFIQDGKYRAYTAAMDKALKNFEYSSEWPDLISALGKLNKVISSHSKYKVIPRRLLLSKRLSQCLHPTLPSGVHFKALETYDLIFKCMGPDKLAAELFIYAAGLFPLLNYAGISVRPSLLNIYETHLLGLGERLCPCLDGFLPAVLLGMEETSDFYQRTTDLLDCVKEGVGVEKFYTTLWRTVHDVPSARQPAINYMLGNKEEIVGEDLTLVLTSVQLCLVDTNILVQRASLELLASRDLGKGEELVKAALRTLLRRDTSLNRRLYTWLAGSEDELVLAIQSLLCDDDEDNFRILVYLLDKSEVCELILDRILVDVVRSLYIHGSGMIRSANLFFSTLHPNYIWDHFFKELCLSVESDARSRVQKPGSGSGSLPELSILLSFLLDLDSTLDKTHLPGLNDRVMELLVEKMGGGGLSVECVHSLLTLLFSFPSSAHNWTLFNVIYVQFLTSTLFSPPILSLDTCFQELMKREVDLYADFESGLNESIHLMSDPASHFRPRSPAPSLPTNPEAFESYKVLNTILIKVTKGREGGALGSSESESESEWMSRTTSKALLIAATMGDSEEVKVNSILCVVALLEWVAGSGVLGGTECVEMMTDYLWTLWSGVDVLPSPNPLYKSSLLSFYALFPRTVERTLSSGLSERDYSPVIQLLRHDLNFDGKSNFDSLVLKCLENLECLDAVKKTKSEGFVVEFLSSVRVLLDPLLRILHENLDSMESVMTFEEKVKEREERRRNTNIIPHPLPLNHSQSHKSSPSSHDQLKSERTGETESGEERERETCGESGESESVVDSAQVLRRKTQLFVDPCGRITMSSKGMGMESEDEESEFEDVESQVQGLGLVLASGDPIVIHPPSRPPPSAPSQVNLSEDEDLAVIDSDSEDMVDRDRDRRSHNHNPHSHPPNYFLDSLSEDKEMEIEEEREREPEPECDLDTIAGNVFGSGSTESEVDLEAEVKLVLDKLDLDLEESLGGLELEHTPDTETEAEAEGGEEKDRTLTLTIPDILTPTPLEEEEGGEEGESDLTLSLSTSQPNTPVPPLPEEGKRPGHRLFSIHPYNTHFLIYMKRADHGRVLYALNGLKNVSGVNLRAFLIAVSTTTVTTTTLATTSTSMSRVTYLELILSYLLKLSQVFYTETESGSGSGGEELMRNVSIHVQSFRLLGLLLTGLLDLINSKGFGSFIRDMFSNLRLQRSVLYTLASLVLMKSEEDLTSTERILKFNYEKDFDILYNEIVRLTTCIIGMESELSGHQKLKVPPSNKYIPNVLFCRQPLYLESLLKTLTNTRLYSCHKATLTAVTNALPFYGAETGRIVSGVVECVCGTLKGSKDHVYMTGILETLTSITHYVLLEQSTTEKVQQQTSSHILYSLVSVFLPVGGSTKEKEGSSPTGQVPALSPAKGELLALLPHLVSTVLSIWEPGVKMKILDLINPIAFNHVTHFIQSIGKQKDQIPVCVELVLAMKVIILENLVSGIITQVKSSDDETHQLTLLRFLSMYMDKCKSLSEIWHLVIGLIKDGPSLPPRSQLIIFEICYKLAGSGIPTVKTDLKELQEASYKLIESVSSHSSTEKKHRNDAGLQLEVVECLTEYLGGVVDMVWGSEDKVLPLVISVVYYVIPHVKFRYPLTHYAKTVKLICNLSGYSYLRKAWKKDVFEILLEQNFFTFTRDCMAGWRRTLDNLFTQDKYTFTELLGRVSVPQTGSLNIFSSKEIEYESRAMLLKRLAFVIFCSKKDQYVKFITNIQERLAEAIKMPTMIPNIQAQVFLCFRVLLLRLSPHHLNALWPIILHEILLVLIQMETDILTKNPHWLHLYLQLCKLLELALNLPPSQLPMFHMYRWSFTGAGTFSFTPHLTRLAELLENTKSSNGIKPLRSNKIESLGELWEFLNNCQQSPASISVFESVLESDFLE